MSGANITEMLQGRAELPAGEARVLRGYISPDRPAPTGFPVPGSPANLLWVLIPDQTLDQVLGPCWWNADHGVELPTQGTACVVLVDQNELATVVWWESTYEGVGRGTSLPASPRDGQEYDYVASAVNGVIWRFRYRSASASTHKWEFVGGQDLYTVESGSITTAAGSGAEAVEITGAPTVTPALSGDYMLTMSCLSALQVASASNLEVFLVRNKEIATRALWLIFIATAQFSGAWLQKRAPLTLEAGKTYEMYAGSNNKLSTNFAFCSMSYQPVRVG